MRNIFSCFVATDHVKRSILNTIAVAGTTVSSQGYCNQRGSADGNTYRLCKECIYSVTLPD